MVADLMESSLVGHPLEGLLFGGSPAPDSLVPRARKAFPTASLWVFYLAWLSNLVDNSAMSISGYKDTG